MYAGSTCPRLPDELWSIIVDFLACTSGLRAAKQLRKVARVSKLFALRARLHPDNIIPEWRCIDCDVLLSTQDDTDSMMPFFFHVGRVHALHGWVKPFMAHVCYRCAMKRQYAMISRMTDELAEDDESDDTTSEWSSSSEYNGSYPLSALVGLDDSDSYGGMNGLNEDFFLSDDDWD